MVHTGASRSGLLHPAPRQALLLPCPMPGPDPHQVLRSALLLPSPTPSPAPAVPHAKPYPTPACRGPSCGQGPGGAGTAPGASPPRARRITAVCITPLSVSL